MKRIATFRWRTGASARYLSAVLGVLRTIRRQPTLRGVAPALLEDKIVIVTGAGRSLGAVIATACADEGATVIATDITGKAGTAVVPHDVTMADDWTRVLR